MPFLYYVPMIASESLYAFGAILTLYLFRRTLSSASILTFTLFTLCCYLTGATKSFLLTALPLFPLALLVAAWRSRRPKFVVLAASFPALFIVFALPFGLLNYRLHDEFILSSNGGSYIFLNANSEVGYLDGVQFDKLSKEMQFKVMNFPDFPEAFFGIKFKQVMKLPQVEKQKAFRQVALSWIRDNPGKFVELKARNVLRCLLPGKSWMHSTRKDWLVSVALDLPLHLLAYAGMLLVLADPAIRRDQWWLLGFAGVMCASLVMFLFNYRYKVFGVEFVYLVYAGWAADRLLRHWAPTLASRLQQGGTGAP